MCGYVTLYFSAILKKEYGTLSYFNKCLVLPGISFLSYKICFLKDFNHYVK